MGAFAVEVLRLAIWFALLAAIFVPLERWCAERPQNVLRPQFGADLFYFFFNGLTLSVALALPAALFAALAGRLLPEGALAAVGSLPVWLRLPLALLVGDFGAYWGHRLSHEIPFLWRFHAVHHSAEEVDWLTNTRAHPVDLVLTRVCGLLPLYLTGLAQAGQPGDLLSAAVVAGGTLWSFFIHANVKWRLGWLEQLVSTPAFHRWHHTRDGLRDRNYAAIFPFIDRALGTLHLPAGWPRAYGIDTPMPPGIAGQLAEPLRRPSAPR